MPTVMLYCGSTTALRTGRLMQTPYTQGFYNGMAHQKKRVIELLEEHLGNMDWDDIKELIEGKNNDLVGNTTTCNCCDLCTSSAMGSNAD